MSSIRNITASSSVPDDLAKRLGPSGVNEILLTLWQGYYDLIADTGSSDKDLVGLVQKKLTQANAWYDAVDIENGESIPEKIENLYKKHQVAGRTIIANKFLDDMLNAKKEFREKYGADTLIEQDFLPDS